MSHKCVSEEKNRDKLARDGAIPLLIKSIASSNDFTLKLACAATLWNLSVNGTPFRPTFSPASNDISVVCVVHAFSPQINAFSANSHLSLAMHR
jgi:hypothetical protein